MAYRFIRNQRVLNVGHHGDFLQMAGGLCNRLWTFRGLLHSVKSGVDQGHCGVRQICARSGNVVFCDVVYEKCGAAYRWLDLRQFSKLLRGISVHWICLSVRKLRCFRSSTNLKEEPENRTMSWN